MNHVFGIAGYFGDQYEAWRDSRQPRQESRQQYRLRRRAERDEALAYEREQADLATAHKAKVIAAKSAERLARAQRRGFEVDHKRVVMAYGVEVAIAATSAYGQYLFALQYSTSSVTKEQMILAPIAYAMVELCRVPLAMSVRSHRQSFIRVAALLGSHRCCWHHREIDVAAGQYHVCSAADRCSYRSRKSGSGTGFR